MTGKQADLDAQMAHLQEVKKLREGELLALPNVVGVGIGYKATGGKDTGVLALVVYVDKKEAKKSLKEGVVPDKVTADINMAAVPTATHNEQGSSYDAQTLEAITDVKEIGVIEAQAFTAKLRPARPGYSIGHYKITAGTFGALVRDTCSPCRIHILSNNHVLANSNAASIGDPILQPGAYDGGQLSADTIAKLTRFVPIQYGAPEKYNLVDCAIATPLDQRLVSASIVGQGIPRGTTEAQLGMVVTKSGRTTQITSGKVIDVNATVAVNYGSSGTAYFRNQIITEAMSQGGDSGSLLLTKDGLATGLLFAGSPQVTIFNHIHNVLMALGVELVTA